MKQVQVDTLIKKYLDTHTELKGSTIRLTEYVGRLLSSCVGNICVDEFNLGHAEDFRASLSVKKVSANSYIKTISPVFSWAVRRGWTERNPFFGLKKYKITHKRPLIYYPDEIHRMLEVADDRWRALILLGLLLRKGECLNLIRDDIGEGIVRITPKEEAAWTWKWEPKDYSTRVIPQTKLLESVLARLTKRLPQWQPYLCLTPERYSYIMKHRGKLTDRIRNEPANNFLRQFKSILNRACVRDGTFHQLRATGLSMLTDSLRIQEVQEIAGHSSPETTKVYLANRPEYLTRAVDRLNRGVAQFG